ncbi:MAG: hypothetical protein IT379_34775, partial [Deltaproteobacteria bacterium]|nr:hypothetical protein [Deltaproteobacteria bacterium]
MTAAVDRPRRARLGWLAPAIGVLGTLVLHGGTFVVLNLSFLVSDPWDIEIGPPPGGIEIGFSLVEASPSASPAGNANAGAAPPSEPEPAGQIIEGPLPRAERPPATSNAAPPPRPRRRPRPQPSDTETSNVVRAARDADAGAPDPDGGLTAVAAADAPSDGGISGGGGGGPDPGTGVLGSLARRGALVTLLLRMDRVRASSLAPDLRAMLVAIPDWRNLVGGSGMDPVADLDALVVATPNPWDARRLAVVARYAVEDARLEEMIAAAQRASGGEAQPIVEQDGIRVAPGLVSDGTERNVALLGDRTLALARPTELPRLLATARARAARRGGDVPSAAEALSSLFETQGAASDAPVAVLEADGVRRFMQGRQGIPTSARFVVTEGPDG